MSVQQISHYRVLSMLGAGGMGEVYLAADMHLDRKVAIKLLPADVAADEQSRSRLFKEARAAAMLDHPNICGVHEVDEVDGLTFIVMQYVDGETLAARAKRMPPGIDETIAIVAQVAEALEEAHAHRLIHRDIKPQNIMINARGQVKVLDFGLAKVMHGPALSAAMTESAWGLTGPGTIAGTLLYMSPEQVRGEELDARSDIFSLGSVSYELLCGRPPFAAASPAEILAAILTRDPSWPSAIDIPDGLRRIVNKCLERDRERRYQSARDLLDDLRVLQRNRERPASERSAAERPHRQGHRGATYIAAAALVLAAGTVGWYWRAADSPSAHSVAVLPFTSVNSDQNTEYLADGITDSIITQLSQLPNLKVVSHTAVFHYRNQEIDARKVGRELGVEAVLTGRLVPRGDAIAIRVELVDARDNSHMWGDDYERPRNDLLSIQRAIPLDVAGKLRVQVSTDSRTRLEQSSTNSPEAYQLYLKGRYAWEQWSEDGSKQSVQYFQEAIKKDPNYALAYAGLATSYLFGSGVGLPQQEAHQRAKDATLRALALDSTCGEAHDALAEVLLYDWDFAGAEREFKRAIELNANDAEAHHQYSHLLQSLGRADEALVEAKTFLDLDPVSESPIGHMAWVYAYSGQYDEAIRWARKDLEGYPTSSARLQLADAYYGKRMFKEAVEEYVKFRAQVGLSPERVVSLKESFTKAGITGYLREDVAQLEANSPEREVMIAERYAQLGDTGQAFDWLKKAFAHHSNELVRLKDDMFFAGLRSDPRFTDLLRQVGLPQ